MCTRTSSARFSTVDTCCLLRWRRFWGAAAFCLLLFCLCVASGPQSKSPKQHTFELTDWLNIWHSTAFGSVRKFHRSFCVCAHLPHRNCVYLCALEWVLVASAQGRTQSLLEFICRSLSWFDEDDNLSVLSVNLSVGICTTTVALCFHSKFFHLIQ